MNEWPQKITKEIYNSLLDYENPIQNTVSSKGYFNYYCYNQYLYEFTNSAFTTRCKLLVTIKDRNAKKRRHSSTSPVTFSRGSIIVWAANVFIDRVSADIRGFVNSVVIFVGIYDCTNTSEKKSEQPLLFFSLLFKSERKCTAARNIYLCPIMLDLLGNKGSHSSAPYLGK